MQLINCTVREHSCEVCPFTETGEKLLEDTMEEIKSYLLQGVNHLCHKDRKNKTVCRGGRSFQLQAWFRMGIIKEPTDQALREAMEARGVEVKSHICKED